MKKGQGLNGTDRVYMVKESVATGAKEIMYYGRTVETLETRFKWHILNCTFAPRPKYRTLNYPLMYAQIAENLDRQQAELLEAGLILIGEVFVNAHLYCSRYSTNRPLEHQNGGSESSKRRKPAEKPG